MELKEFLGIFFSVLLLAFSIISTQAVRVSADNDSEYMEVSLSYLAMHMEDFIGKKVRTTGTVYFLASIYQFESFQLSGAIPVKAAGLPLPLENARIEVFGIIEYCKLEGGFFYLNTHSWTYATETLPEFQSLILLPLFMAATLFAVILYKRKRAS